MPSRTSHTCAADRMDDEFFGRHPTRTHRVRPATSAEVNVQFSGPDACPVMAVRRVRGGGYERVLWCLFTGQRAPDCDAWAQAAFELLAKLSKQGSTFPLFRVAAIEERAARIRRRSARRGRVVA